MKAWFLSQFYLCPIHNWKVPVCTAYGNGYIFPRQPETDDGWALVLMDTAPHQIEAAKLDPRVVFCGKDYNTPPSQVLTNYASWLDPNASYTFMGQVLAKLAETEPSFGHQ